jgi:glutaredoxin
MVDRRNPAWIAMPVMRAFMVAVALFAAFAEAGHPCPGINAAAIGECGGLPFAMAGKMGPRCPVAQRLIPFVAYLEEKNEPCSTMIADFNKRYTTLTNRITCPIDLADVQWIGASRAPVTLVMYVAMSCPHCKKLYASLYDSITSGTGLAKLVRMGVKSFSTSPFDKILAAAALRGKQPAFLRIFARMNGGIDDTVARSIADSIGMSFDTLKALAETPQIAKRVAGERAEALRNGVTSTPTLFLNERRYYSDKDARWVLDAVRYMAKSAAKRQGALKE